MQPEIYSDGIGEITVSGSIVRVDLMSLSATERDEHNAPRPVLRQRVIFSVEGFANSVDVMQKALAGLVDAGVVSRTPATLPGRRPADPPPDAPRPPRDDGAPAPGPKRSPNFT